jgi:branched-chain amino acid transport system substrate-binding protein
VIVGESGPDSEDYNVAAGVFKAWEKWTNDNGGVNGHPVQVVILDDQESPAVALAAAHTLVEGDHVLAAACYGGGCIQNFGPYAALKSVPLIGGQFSASWGTTFGHPNVYQVDTSLFAEEGVLFQYAKMQGATKMGFVADVQTGSPTVAKAWTVAMESAGLPVVKSVVINDTSPSFVAPCLALKQANVDAIGDIIGDRPAKALMDSCATQGYQPMWTGQSIDFTSTFWHDPAFSKSISTIPEFPWWDNSVPAIANFNQVLQKYDPGYLSANPAAATEAWVIGTVFATALKNGHVGDNPTSAQVVAGLQTISNDTFGGLTPPLTFANGGNLTPPLCVYGAHVVNGQPALLNGGKQLCTPKALAVKIFDTLQGIKSS